MYEIIKITVIMQKATRIFLCLIVITVLLIIIEAINYLFALRQEIGRKHNYFCPFFIATCYFLVFDSNHCII